jgi:hypothetical protein
MKTSTTKFGAFGIENIVGAITLSAVAIAALVSAVASLPWV